MRYEFNVIGSKQKLVIEDEINNVLTKYSPSFRLIGCDVNNKKMKFELNIANKFKKIFDMDMTDADVKKKDDGFDCHQIVLEKIIVTKGTVK